MSTHDVKEPLARVVRWSCNATLALVTCIAAPAMAQVPASSVDYQRTDDYTYTSIGQVQTHTVEPLNAPRCNVTTYGYDPQGNQTSSKVENCSGATGSALFATRNAGAAFPAVASQGITTGGSYTANTTVAIKAGIGATTTSVGSSALLQTSSQEFDPRFGSVTKLTDPNALVTKVIVDDFGREIRAINADGTYVETQYCYLGSPAASSANCPAPAASESPSGAVMFTNAVKKTATDQVITAYQRVFIDRLGRVIRTTTQGFDGASQPGGYGASAVVAADRYYNSWGLPTFETGQYFLTPKSATTTGSNDMPLTANVYDRLGRVTGLFRTDPTATGVSPTASNPFGPRVGAWTAITYAGLTTITTNDKGLKRTEERNAVGLTARVTDNAGAQLAFAYDGFGYLLRSKDALGNVIDHQYDYRGAKRSTNDPDKGLWAYDVNALGELVRQQSPKQTSSTATTLVYDGLGRLTTRTEPEFVSTWTYDTYTDAATFGPCNKGIGRLCQTSTTAGVNKRTVYDNLGRPTSTRVDISSSSKSFAFATTYDGVTGRVATSSYPTGLTVGYSYTALGTQDKLILKTPTTGVAIPVDTVLWQAAIVSADDRIERATLGNGVSSVSAFEAGTGRIVDLKAGRTGTELLNHHYAWDSIGNLTQRIDNNGDGTNPTTEVFSYDDLNRLVQYQVNGAGMPSPFTRSVTLTYNALGMLLYKSDVGTYTYGTMGASQPHALRSVALVGGGTRTFGTDVHGNVTSASSGRYASIAYTSFDLPDASTGVQGPAGSPTYAWSYDERHARIKQTKVGGGNTRTTFYLHPDLVGGLAFESESNSSPAADYQRHFLPAGGGTVGVLTSAVALPALAAMQTTPPVPSAVAAAKVEYWHTDHLGSVAATSDQSGTLQQRYSYDPFGKRRYTTGANDPSGAVQADWSVGSVNGTGRGFTAHEELDDVGVVHMNGRLYDDFLGIFLQPDNVISNEVDLQSYAKYSYVNNNPLNATDPSGFETAAAGAAPAESASPSATPSLDQPGTGNQESYDGRSTPPPSPSTLSFGSRSGSQSGNSVAPGISWGSTGAQLADKSGKVTHQSLNRAYEQLLREKTAHPAADRAWWAEYARRLDAIIQAKISLYRNEGNSLTPLIAVELGEKAIADARAGGFLGYRDAAIIAGIAIANGFGSSDSGASPPSVWTLRPFPRGRAIENQLGANLPSNFPTIDRWWNGAAISIKSLDVRSRKYQNIATLTRTINDYIAKVRAFNGRSWGGVTVDQANIVSRELVLAVPPGATPAQQAALNAAVNRAQAQGVQMTVTVIP